MWIWRSNAVCEMRVFTETTTHVRPHSEVILISGHSQCDAEIGDGNNNLRLIASNLTKDMSNKNGSNDDSINVDGLK
jgi:hypothetical protein